MGRKTLRANGRPSSKKEWTQEQWDSFNLEEFQHTLKKYPELERENDDYGYCLTETCQHIRDMSQQVTTGPSKGKRNWAARCTQCNWTAKQAPEKAAKRKLARQKKTIAKGSQLKYYCPKINVGINHEWYRKNQHDDLDPLGVDEFGDESDSDDEQLEKEAKRLRRAKKAAAPLAGGLRTTYYQHPTDPSLEIPIPTIDPTYPHLPLHLDSICARNNFRRIAGDHAKYLAETAWQEPRPAKCRHEECGIELDWRKGDYAQCSVDPRDNTLRVTYGKGKWGQVYCREHLNEVRQGELREINLNNREHELARHRIINAPPLRRARKIARSLFDRQVDHEEERGVDKKDRLLTIHGGNQEDCFSAIVRVLLELPGKGGSMPGDLLRRPGFNPRDKASMDQRFQDFERDAQCRTCKRKLSLRRGQDHRNCDLPSIDRLDSALDYVDSKQTLQLSCLGCQIGQNDLTPAERSDILAPLLNNLLVDTTLGDAAAEYLHLALLKEETSISDLQESRMKELRKLLEDSGSWSEAAAEKEWLKRMEHIVGLQSRREFRAGRPGKEETINGQKVLNRHEWAPGGTFDDNMAKAKTFFLATGGLCPVFGVPTRPLLKKNGHYQGMLSLTLDRTADDGCYSYENVMPMLQFANFFKSTLPVFRTQARLDAFINSQPSLKKISETRGFKVAVTHYLRLEIAGVWRDESEVDDGDEEEVEVEVEMDVEAEQIAEEGKTEQGKTLSLGVPSISSESAGKGKKKVDENSKTIPSPARRFNEMPPPPIPTRPRFSLSSQSHSSASSEASTSRGPRPAESLKKSELPPSPPLLDLDSVPLSTGRLRAISSKQPTAAVPSLLRSTSTKASRSESSSGKKFISLSPHGVHPSIGPSNPQSNSSKFLRQSGTPPPVPASSSSIASPYFSNCSFSSSSRSGQVELKKVFASSVGRASSGGVEPVDLLSSCTAPFRFNNASDTSIRSKRLEIQQTYSSTSPTHGQAQDATSGATSRQRGSTGKSSGLGSLKPSSKAAVPNATTLAANSPGKKHHILPSFDSSSPAKRLRLTLAQSDLSHANDSGLADKTSDTSFCTSDSSFDASTTDTSAEVYPDSFCEGGEYEGFRDYDEDAMDYMGE